jgi:sugar phosphate isomerase/epimerase
VEKPEERHVGKHAESAAARVAARVGMSTSWNAAAARSGRQIVDEITALGFRTLEVDYRVASDAAPQLMAAVRAGQIAVSSVHNFTPRGPGEPATDRGGHKLSLTSLDESERQRAVDLTLVSAEFGLQLGARALVLHLGETDLGRDYVHELRDAIEAKGVASPEAEVVRERIKAERARRIAPFMDAGVTSLLDILGVTRNSGLMICLENRYHYHQIPLPDEVLEIKRRVPSPRLCYWHDLGHAHVMEVLGFLPHLENLRLLKDHLYGLHIHDSRFTSDHRAPGTGEIDFRTILAEAPAAAMRVLELAPAATREEILRGLEVLAEADPALATAD